MSETKVQLLLCLVTPFTERIEKSAFDNTDLWEPLV